MNKGVLIQIGRFVLLILIQVLVCNHINFLGYLNPYIYILFILLAPITINRSFFLIQAFILGLTVDMLGDSVAFHTTASLIIAYLRPVILRWTFGLSYEFQTMKLSKVPLVQQIVYVSIMVLIHHLILFSQEIFNLSLILLIIKKSLFSSLFTIIITMMVLILFRKSDS